MNNYLRPGFFIFSILISGCIMMNTGCHKTTNQEGITLEQGFLNPPDSARPRVWWHWMNGNITQQGIRADLEWMHRIGIAGFQNFDAALMTPQIVEKRLVYMTPEWKDAFRFTTRLADSLGLEMAIAGSPGWSESGGPWVKPEQAMKKYVWSETTLEGGKPFHGILPKPPTTTGPFQNLTTKEAFSLSVKQETAPLSYYADAAVVAYKIPEEDISLSTLNPKVTSSGGKFTLAALTDGDPGNSSLLPYTKPGTNAWIMYEFAKPETFSSLTIVGGGFAGQFGFGSDKGKRSLECSNDGKSFSKITDIPIEGVEERTLDFTPTTARFFRFTWETPPATPSFNIGAALGIKSGAAPKGPTGTLIAELALHKIPRIHRFEDKAAFATASDLQNATTLEIKQDDAIQTASVIDLTSKMAKDGTLQWTPPAGKWTVIRLGYSLTGHKNSPASPEATGLEVDKLNAGFVKDYFTQYLNQYKDATGGLMGAKGLHYIITDSWEAGTQNWTDLMLQEFKTRRGYDMVPWIPVLTGHIVQSAKASDQFLWDFRKTLGDLLVENHYDQLTALLKERGMERYTESHESGRAFIGDGMDVKRKAAIPMSATWTPGGLDPGTEVAPSYKADVRESASVAHIYGQNKVAAESMTAIGSAWAWCPETLKPTADMELANGLNRFVIHTSVHQPVDDKIPGLGLGPFGQWFTRHETWAEQAGAWTTYLARSCFMLQQGKFVADIAYFYGEDNNITSLFGAKLPEIPEGYAYDFVNADALLTLLSVKDNRLVTPSGMSYQVLALDSNCRQMSLPVLKKIKQLAEDGAIISGPKPMQTPSLKDDQKEFDALVAQLWSQKEVTSVGKGKVITGKTLKEVLKAQQIIPDFSFSENEKDNSVLFVHRKMSTLEFYWINNRTDSVKNLKATFRMTGYAPEIWHPETGRIEKAGYVVTNGITNVNIPLEPNDAVFVVFRQLTNEKSYEVPSQQEKQLLEVKGPWNIVLQPKRGASQAITLSELQLWNENTDPAVKFFSGTGTYTFTINAEKDWFTANKTLWLDLGQVKNLAEVWINGKSYGVLWKTPFQMDITGFLKPGGNKIELKVTNLWVNRLIGDQQPATKQKSTYTTLPFYQANSPLKPSGLLGPVRIIQKW